jgi:hypothetical protein
LALDKELIKESLTENDIKIILTDLGSSRPTYDRNGNMIFSTVCHGGHKHKLYYYEESKLFHCYTDCGDNFDVFEVVIRAKKEQGYTFSFYEAVRYVANLTGKMFTKSSLFDSMSHKIDDWEWINRLNRKKPIDVNLPVYSDKVMDVFMKKPHEEWIDEGISVETLEKFNISYYQRDNRIVIPHYDIDSNLVGIRGRALDQEDLDNGRKYMPLSVGKQLYNHPTMYNLYGLHKTKEAIKRLKKAAIFEGEKSIFKCEDLYREDNFSVASCSSTISNFQRDLLLSLDIDEVIICYDRQFQDPHSKEAYLYAEKLMKLANKFSPYVRTCIVWDELLLTGYKDSPVDCGKETLEKLMKSKYEIKTLKEVI